MNSSDVKPFKPGGGGRIYRDARELDEQRKIAAAQEVEKESGPQPWSDTPEEKQEKPAPTPARQIRPPRIGQITAPAPPAPEPEPEPGTDWRELTSTILELVGISLITAGCYLIALWLALIIAGICLTVLGVASSGKLRR